MKQFLMAAVLVVIAVAVRIGFYNAGPGYWTTPDTLSYFGTSQIIAKTRSVADPWRTPVYPLIIMAPFLLEGKPIPASYIGVFLPEFLAIRIAQSVAGVATVLFFYLLLCRMGVQKTFAWILGLVVSLSWPILLYEDLLITESFSLFILILTMYVSVSAFRRWHTGKGIGLIILFILGVFLHPSTIALPLIFTSVLVWYHRKRTVFVWAVAAICIYAVFLLTYSVLNNQQHGYFGISRISDVNLLGKILQYQLPIQHAHDTEMKNLVTPYVSTHVADPWIIMNDNTKLYEARYARPMHGFISEVLRQNAGTYTIRAIAEIPSALLAPAADRSYAPVEQYSHQFFGLLKRINDVLSKGYLLLLVIWAFYLYNAFTKRSVYAVSISLFWLVGIYYIIGSVFLSYGDYGRLILPVLPILLVVSYAWWYDLLRSVLIWVKHLSK